MQKKKENNCYERGGIEAWWCNMDELYRKDYGLYQSHLQQMTQTMILLNITLFFLTELVTKHGYYYTFISLIFLFVVQIALVAPLGFMRSLRSYCFFLFLEGVGLYFFISSAVYWIVTNRQ